MQLSNQSLITQVEHGTDREHVPFLFINSCGTYVVQLYKVPIYDLYSFCVRSKIKYVLFQLKQTDLIEYWLLIVFI